MKTATRYGDFSVFEGEDLISSSLTRFGEWAEEEISLLLDFVSPGDIVVDVGAFIGTHTVAFAKRVGAEGVVPISNPASC
jgi:hypothetical protein